MKIKLETILTKSELQEVTDVARERVAEQIRDMERGMRSAGYSYGSSGEMNARTYGQRFSDALIGAKGEKIASKITKSVWTRERLQYSRNRNPDLLVNFNGEQRRCEVRASRRNYVIHRKYRDRNTSDNTILIGIANMSNEESCEIVFTTFGEMKDLCNQHPEWLNGEDTDSPYYKIPPSFLRQDFSNFN